jgi:hypothetical protein
MTRQSATIAVMFGHGIAMAVVAFAMLASASVETGELIDVAQPRAQVALGM